MYTYLVKTRFPHEHVVINHEHGIDGAGLLYK